MYFSSGAARTALASQSFPVTITDAALLAPPTLRLRTTEVSIHDVPGKELHPMPSPPFGRLVRMHRHRLKWSQEKLAERAGISARHMSFLENGRAHPSREVALEIANALEVPTHELGTFLEAAGYVASTPSSPIAVPGLSDLMHTISDPALMHDRYGTVTAVNGRALALFGFFLDPAQLGTGDYGYTWFELLQPRMQNWRELQAFYRRRLFLELLRSEQGDPELERVHRRWAGDAESMRDVAAAVARVAMEWKKNVAEFRLLTATLGTPSDVALRDFRLALILPGNELARELIQRARTMAAVAEDGPAVFPPSSRVAM
jgi:transcriptional regulator with XRE-family HTH domain